MSASFFKVYDKNQIFRSSVSKFSFLESFIYGRIFYLEKSRTKVCKTMSRVGSHKTSTIYVRLSVEEGKCVFSP